MIKNCRRRKMTEKTFFSDEDRLDKLSKYGETKTLNKINTLIPWEEFRPILRRVRKDNPRGGRPPFDEILMFKCLILQSMYDLSDEETEFRILNMITYSEFLGIKNPNDVPDSNTIWLFREKLIKENLLDKIFEKFNSILFSQGLILKKGMIVDATFVTVPKQRNTREENAVIKKNQIPESFEKKTAQQRNHKDCDARWTVKNTINYFGYKLTIIIDEKTKAIIAYRLTSANVHDSQSFLSIIPSDHSDNEPLYGDSAYMSKEIISTLKSMKIEPRICEKRYGNKPLTEEQIRRNHRLSKKRCRVEHVFGYMRKHSGKFVRTIGAARATAKSVLSCLTYNMHRLVFYAAQNRQKSRRKSAFT